MHSDRKTDLPVRIFGILRNEPAPWFHFTAFLKNHSVTEINFANNEILLPNKEVKYKKRMKKPVKLITKTTFIYITFILITFFVTAGFIIKQTDHFITQDAEQYFTRKEYRLEKSLNEKNEDPKQIRGLEKVENLNKIQRSRYPYYSDTIIYISQMDESLLFSQKTILKEYDKDLYEYTMFKNINDFEKLKNDLISTIIRAFIILSLAMVFFSFFLSGFLFRPFHKLLDFIGGYKIGKGLPAPDIKTSTQEFLKMKQLSLQMLNQMEYDYKNLKEYTENMAHEIQTPLSIIRSKTEALISDEKVMEKQSPIIKSIYREINHLSRLGSTLNLLTKIENGEYNNTLQFKTKPYLLKHIDSVKEMYHLKGFKLKIDLHPGHSLSIDPILFDIIIKNLLNNALKHGDSRQPIEIITTEKVFSVCNQSDDLPLNEEHIFKRFAGNNKHKSSLGLGLALVKRICDLNGLLIRYYHHQKKHCFQIEVKSKN